MTVDNLATLLSKRYGIGLSGEQFTGGDGAHFVFRPVDLHDNEGFRIDCRVGWRSVLATFVPGTFAADLLNEMSQAPSERLAFFVNVTRSIADEGAIVRVQVNASQQDPQRPDTWPQHWKDFGLELERTPLMIDHDNMDAVAGVVLHWGGGLLGMVLALVPTEEVQDAQEEDVLDPSVSGMPEGSVETVKANRYERSRLNRALCLSINGSDCRACGISFERRYGPLGQDYIHVHHVVPVSQLGPGYVVDPARDLVPVCPNCHAMLHRTDPPMSIDDLRSLLEARRDTP